MEGMNMGRRGNSSVPEVNIALASTSDQQVLCHFETEGAIRGNRRQWGLMGEGGGKEDGWIGLAGNGDELLGARPLERSWFGV